MIAGFTLVSRPPNQSYVNSNDKHAPSGRLLLTRNRSFKMFLLDIAMRDWQYPVIQLLKRTIPIIQVPSCLLQSFLELKDKFNDFDVINVLMGDAFLQGGVSPTLLTPNTPKSLYMMQNGLGY